MSKSLGSGRSEAPEVNIYQHAHMVLIACGAELASKSAVRARDLADDATQLACDEKLCRKREFATQIGQRLIDRSIGVSPER